MLHKIETLGAQLDSEDNLTLRFKTLGEKLDSEIFIVEKIEKLIMPLNIGCSMLMVERKYEKNYLCVDIEDSEFIIRFEESAMNKYIIEQEVGSYFRSGLENKINLKRKEITSKLVRPNGNEFPENTKVELIGIAILEATFRQFWKTPLMRYSDQIKVCRINADGFYNNQEEWSKDEILEINNFVGFN